MIKKIILWVALCVLSTSATLANDKVIADLKANAPEQVSCQFEQQKFLKGMAKPVISKGLLQYQPQNFAMNYSQPEGDYIQITPDASQRSIPLSQNQLQIPPDSGGPCSAGCRRRSDSLDARLPRR